MPATPSKDPYTPDEPLPHTWPGAVPDGADALSDHLDSLLAASELVERHGLVGGPAGQRGVRSHGTWPNGSDTVMIPQAPEPVPSEVPAEPVSSGPAFITLTLPPVPGTKEAPDELWLMVSSEASRLPHGELFRSVATQPPLRSHAPNPSLGDVAIASIAEAVKELGVIDFLTTMKLDGDEMNLVVIDAKSKRCVLLGNDGSVLDDSDEPGSELRDPRFYKAAQREMASRVIRQAMTEAVKKAAGRERQA